MKQRRPKEKKRDTMQEQEQTRSRLYGGGSLRILQEDEPTPDGWTVLSSTIGGGRRIVRKDVD